MRRTGRSLPDDHLAVAGTDDDVRHRDDVDHGVQDLRHRRRDDAWRPDGFVRRAAVCGLPRGLHLLPHRVCGGADSGLPGVHPGVLGRPRVPARPTGALLMDERAAGPQPPAGRSPWRLLRRVLSLLLVHGFLLAGAAFMLLPFVWMLITSIKPPDEIFNATMSLWPKRFYGVENYRFALTSAPLLRFALNGVFVC